MALLACQAEFRPSHLPPSPTLLALQHDCSAHRPAQVHSLRHCCRLNYFLIDRGPNSAMGSKVEGFRGEFVRQVPSYSTSL